MKMKATDDLKVMRGSGYHGEDSMRAKAEKLLKNEMSSKGKESMKKEMKKGGAVKTPDLSIQTIGEAEKMKKGGMCKKMAAGGAAKVRKGMATLRGLVKK